MHLFESSKQILDTFLKYKYLKYKNIRCWINLRIVWNLKRISLIFKSIYSLFRINYTQYNWKKLKEKQTYFGKDAIELIMLTCTFQIYGKDCRALMLNFSVSRRIFSFFFKLSASRILDRSCWIYTKLCCLRRCSVYLIMIRFIIIMIICTIFFLDINNRLSLQWSFSSVKMTSHTKNHWYNAWNNKKNDFNYFISKDQFILDL